MFLRASPILIIGLLATGDSPQSSSTPAARLVAMRAIAESIVVEKTARGVPVKLERLAEPVYRFDDPARQYSDGTVWAWGPSGRPAALLTLSRDRSPTEGLRWIAEMTSFAPDRSPPQFRGSARGDHRTQESRCRSSPRPPSRLEMRRNA